MTDPPDSDLPESSEPRARNTYQTTADRRLLARIERHYDDTRFFQRFELPVYYREPTLHLEPERWNTGYLQVHDYFIPHELEQDLHALTPQSLLRDLYRPVRDNYWVEREVLVSLDWGGREAMVEARGMKRREARPTVEPGSAFMLEVRRLWRELVNMKWAPTLPDDQERKKVSVVYDPSLLI
jgi:hypothetical protein